MTTFLLVINFIIDGVIILGLFLLFTKLRSKDEDTEKQERMAREIEGTFQSYLEEIKEENKRFEQQMTSHSLSPYDQSDQEEKQQTVEPRLQEDQSVVYHPPEIEDEGTVELSDQVRVKQMELQGYSTEEIARSLNLGKTEVDLMLKFNRGT
ncbi:DUF6115 domain-containing protein [Salimicrobium flavidum]|uniref:Uncharacterized protein n=1 Tax=Salimicrobium flavidum TaxID=570947 RepID=A0A1N7IKP0_9BACI|nr:hypothetical protein [Salimicrobium flavidum]SIS37556.1 hypothetical protein SAMN05421687_101381 [Salimicrobium flavidum]